MKEGMDISDKDQICDIVKQENRLIVCPKRKQTKLDEKSPTKVKLEHVLGLTITSNAALDSNPKTGVIAYTAGCTIVFLNPFRDRQTHLINPTRKTVTCLAYSRDGRYLATGEYGHQSSIRVWDLLDSNVQCVEFSGHKCGVNCVIFSPNQKYLISVGSQHDMIINVWDWKIQQKISSNKISARVKAISFSENGDYFVTVGNRHVKFWYLQVTRQTLYKEPVPLMGRSAILGEQRNNDFVDVVCGKGEFQDSVYVITRGGILCEFNNRRLLDRWVDLKTASAYCVTASEDFIFIGCADSIIRCFSAATLEFVTTLPRTHYLGVDVAKALSISHTTQHPKNARFPDTIALTFDEEHKRLTAVYNDHSLYIWDVRNIKKVGKSCSYLYHCACIWGVEIYPESDDSSGNLLPSGSFITCSSDDTVRVWNLRAYHAEYNSTISAYHPNIYSNELLKVLYIDPELQYLKDSDIGIGDKSEHVSYDGRNGVRSICICPDGVHLACGDRSGNIRIYDLKTIQEVCKIEAHDSEVLCLEYSPYLNEERKRLLVSASRDRLIHIFDASDEYEFMETLDDHSSSITAVRFLELHNQLQLVSCSADKSIVFRRYQDVKDCHFVRERVIAGKSTLYDMTIDTSQKYVLTACQDRNVRVYNVHSGKHCKVFKGSTGEDGSVIKVALDNSGRYLATSCTDKTLCIYDYYSGECIASIAGHSELVTGLRFSNDCEHLISASGDGCIFIWRLPRDMVVTMQARLCQQHARSSSRSQVVYDACNDQMNDTEVHKNTTNNKVVVASDARFGEGHLPLWVTKTINDEPPSLLEGGSRAIMPRGRWAQRADYRLSSDGMLTLPSNRESDGSKEDSSVDSGTETCRPEDRHEKLIVPHKMVRSPPRFITDMDTTMHKLGRTSTFSSLNEIDIRDGHRARHTDDSSLGSFKNEDFESTEHDGDVEDYSEAESGDNDVEQKVLYYPSVDDALSEFKVNAIDAEELRRSQRKFRRTHPKKTVTANTDASSYSVSGSQESDDDDDDGSTPCAETNTEKNFSSLSSGIDNMEIFSQREKYLKNTFDSLGGVEVDVVNGGHDKRTISSQHHGSFNGDVRNVDLVHTTKQNMNDIEAHRKRQELKSRIDDIRERLQCVRYQSALKSSQSTLDLRRNGEVFLAPSMYSSRKINRPAVDDEIGGIRRACSLSDISGPGVPLNNQSLPKPNRAVPVKHSSNKQQYRDIASKPPLAYKPISRSSSEITLHMPDTIHHRKQSRVVDAPATASQRIMRPTISSQNKSKQSAVSSKGTSNAGIRRRSVVYASYSALNDVGNVEDSSSEDNKSDHFRSGMYNDKPTSKRMAFSKFLERSCSERDLSTLSHLSTKKKHNQMNEAKSEVQLFKNTLPDVTNVPLSRDLLKAVIDQFKKTADNVIRIHDRLTVENIDEDEKKKLLSGLRCTIGQVQSSLKKLELPKLHDNEFQRDDTFPDNVTSSANAESLPGFQQSGNVMSMIQQYSDVLVSLVQKKVDRKST